SGPFVLAMASERAKVSPSAPHGPRVVVIGTSWIFSEKNWNEPAPVRGAAILVESALSWLAAKPQILDVPERPTVAAGIRITDESRSKVAWYVLFYMPLAVLILALAVWFWRRSTERAERKPAEG
ncbi:MAG: GldG family protein, partial [Polyangiaceae bacterium]